MTTINKTQSLNVEYYAPMRITELEFIVSVTLITMIILIAVWLLLTT